MNTIILSIIVLLMKLMVVLLALTNSIRVIKLQNLKIGDRVRITKYKEVFSKGYSKKWSKKGFIIDSVLKANHRTYKIKDLNRETIIGSFYEKQLL